MQPTAKLEKPRNLKTFFVKLGSPEMRQAAARGLNEHTEEARRQSVTRMTSYTGVARSRVGSRTKVIKVRPSTNMVACMMSSACSSSAFNWLSSCRRAAFSFLIASSSAFLLDAGFARCLRRKFSTFLFHSNLIDWEPFPRVGTK